jgi:hypothetical protein
VNGKTAILFLITEIELKVNNIVALLALSSYSQFLKKEVVLSSETLVIFYQDARCHIPEDNPLNYKQSALSFIVFSSYNLFRLVLPGIVQGVVLN